MNFEKMDRWLLVLIIGLLIFGVFIINSVSTYESLMLMIKSKGAEYCYPETGNNCNNFYFNRHVIHVLTALPLFFIALFIPTQVYRKIAPLFFMISLLLLLVLFIEGVGSDYGTARSWINVPFLPSIQPSELMKLAVIFYLAIWMEKKEQEVRTFQQGFLPFVVLLSVTLLPLALQPDFGSVLVIGMIAVSMFFVAGGNILHIFGGGAIASLIAWPIILSHEYIRQRFLAFLNPDSLEMQDAVYHIKQSLITVGSGGFYGVGYNESGQKNGWLPEIQSDTIFAAAAEELGFLRVMFLVLAFFFIAYRGFCIAERSNDRFSKLVATGITAWITFQAIINICVTIGLMPITGITLPFISYGGTSLLSLLFASGILLHISMNQEESRFFYKRSKVGPGTPNHKRVINRTHHRF